MENILELDSIALHIHEGDSIRQHIIQQICKRCQI